MVCSNVTFLFFLW